MTIPQHELSADEARRIILRAQGLLGADTRRGGVPTMLRRLAAVQLDTISVLARSHELVAYARLGPIKREAVESAYWSEPATAFEYWCHAACVLPIEDWPYYAFRRRAFKERKYRWHAVPDNVGEIVQRLRNDGPMTTTELGGAKRSAEWWDWSDVKIAVEWLLDIGEVVCTRRVGWRRIYELAERVVPAELLEREITDEECVAHLAARAGRALGVATRADLLDFLRLRNHQASLLDQALADGATGLVPVGVQGWGKPAWADQQALASPVRGRSRTALLSPFDSLIWDRRRTERVFGFNHRLEAYVPKHKREHGYFTMPVLAGGRLIGRVDPARDDTTLVAKRISFEPLGGSRTKREYAVAAMREGLHAAAGWVGCHGVRAEVVDPPELAEPLRAALPLTLADFR